MRVVRTVDELRAAAPSDVVLVPTMGGLHAGHLALARRAREAGGCVVVSIYVNPLQFGAGEDFADYPRRLADDCDKLRGLADVVYAPDDAAMYPQPQTISIALPPLADEFCGRSRPGFFHGVAVVVCKLFNQARPRAAVFGRKDYQQACIVRMMARQLAMPVEIILHPTVREADGLAMSSRNEYLSADERRRAPALYAALRRAAAAIAGGGDADAACDAGRRALAHAGMACDYFAARAAETLAPAAAGDSLVLLAAAQLGRARLIDNVDASPAGAD